MSLFDFVANIGKKIFKKEDDPATASGKLKDHISQANPGIDGLGVTFNNGVATITGTAKDQAALEKAVLMAGNAEGVHKVDISTLKLGIAGTQSRFYDIKQGDTLWGIAQAVYGDGKRHEEIFAANREVIQDPNLIFVGQRIRIP